MRTGDAANAFVLLNTGMFMTCVVAHALGQVEFFSASFLNDGFCVANKDKPLWTSHILSFYVDTMSAAVLKLLSRRYKDMAGFEPVSLAAAGVFIHGVGHLVLWAQKGARGTRPRILTETAPVLAATVLGLSLFFWLLLRSAPNVPHSRAACFGVVHALVLGLVIPPVFGFTYVQTALLWTVVSSDMIREKKDIFYDLSAVVINLPVGLVGWLEATGCDLFLKRMGGHVWYDGTIPVCMFAYYALALSIKPSPTKTGKVE